MSRASDVCLRMSYACSYDGASALVRPYHLAWRGDAGCSGYVEPDQAALLLEVMMSEGFMSNPDIPGCEKLHVTRIPTEFLDDTYTELPSLDGVWPFEKSLPFAEDR